MQGLNSISSCRHCRFYQLEGRRGGTCQQLGVPVQGSWKACHLAVPAFVQAWEQQEIKAWKLEAIELAESCFAVSQSTISAAPAQNNLAKNLTKETESRSLVPISAIVLARKASPVAPIA